MSEIKSCVINGLNMLTREQAHGELARKLPLPDYYGGNLDALWDVVSTMSADVNMINTITMLGALGLYGCKLLGTLYEAAQENPTFHFEAR